VKVIVAVVGKARHATVGPAARDYESRAARHWPLVVREVREEPAGGASAAVVRRREGERLLEQVPAGAHLVACDACGARMTSEEFARWLQGLRESATDVCFVIGGALGLSDEVRAAARTTLALAPWTLPHELARLVLSEQLYRAGTIVRGQPYHK
jgi:23S rRNA (pseudouridine1915-N3)-methyltransferase